MRNEEQLLAIAELNDREVASLRKFIALPEDTVGLDGIDKASCHINANDSCRELGITEANGFTAREISNACERFTLSTASLFELI